MMNGERADRTSGAEALRAALRFTGLPIAMGQYTGKADRYLVMNFTSAGQGFADDAPSFEKYLWQLHLFCPMTCNVQGLLKDMKQAIFQAGFSFPSVVSDADENGQHLILEFDYLEWINDGWLGSARL